MAKKSCALIGMGTGPKVHVGASGAVQIRGMGEGEDAYVRTFDDEGGVQAVRKLKQNGSHILDYCRFAEVTYQGKNRGFIACILIGG